MSRNVSFFVAALLIISGAFSNGRTETKLTPFEDKDRFGYRNARGQTVIPPRYILANEFSREGIAAVVDEAGWAYINIAGEIVIRPWIVDNGPDYFQQGMARFKANGRFGFFNKAGKIVIKAQFDFAAPFHEGLAAICAGCRMKSDGEHESVGEGKWGYIDKKGAVVIPPRFESAEAFKNGRATVRIGGVAKLINRRGTILQ